MNEKNITTRSERNKQNKPVKETKQADPDKPIKKGTAKNKTIAIPLVTAVTLFTLVLVVGYVFFQSHFLPTAEANGVKIGWLNVSAAEEKLKSLNTDAGDIVIETADGQKQTIQIPEKYAVTKEYLNENIGSQSIELPLNESFKTELEAKLNELTFAEGTPSKDARIERLDTGFQIVPEENGTVIDKESLMNKIISDVEKNTGNYIYNVADFYQKPAVLQDNEDLKKQLTALTQKENKKITVAVSDKTVEIPKETLQSFINDEGQVDTGVVEIWLNQISLEYSAVSQPITFTNVHGETRQYKNNGSYGWSLNVAETIPLVVQALDSANLEETVTAVIDGDVNQSSVVNQTYIEIDLNNQMMYYFENGVKTLETPVITGRYHKGTATVPGFHTILYKDTNTSLKGQMLDGSSYDVPVSYWMPLLSYGGVVTQIGIHDADYKLEHFGNKEAYKTTLGSNGCINTPGNVMAPLFAASYPGMPVIIYGTIYDDAPGEFDKPVDYGTPV
ncbi:L,D-transpeptidase family protein [Enterococcus sp. BWT-B8]|uniref:L,D-transpeptidase family protein n=1 Tax=Enterococcus sp. BWT-B8 TaxID=2885157 RepID=UPI001E4B81B3|nr:L,D-transpeptidase family protein [Enterococcus sp. BWT-B8]MCB5952191.1 L,D-transpeptidase family protein [Enterococcus sp. BWT-B8]